MTREEANKELERAFDVLDHTCHMDNRRKEAFNMARVALSAEPCEDCISREDALDLVYDYETEWLEMKTDNYRDYINSLPSVQPTAKENLVVEDCISREEVCDYIAEFVNHEYATDRERELVKNIIDGIQHLPSIQPKTGHWIPVSERLPENHDDVLVWFEYVKDDWDCAWWGLAYYSLQYKKWVVSTNERNPLLKVIAWMPLPKPYNTESEE